MQLLSELSPFASIPGVAPKGFRANTGLIDCNPVGIASQKTHSTDVTVHMVLDGVLLSLERPGDCQRRLPVGLDSRLQSHAKPAHGCLSLAAIDQDFHGPGVGFQFLESILQLIQRLTPVIIFSKGRLPEAIKRMACS